MTKTTLAILAASCLAAPLAQASHPSFDCGKATHEVELIICKDTDLAQLDRQLAELYPQILKDTPASQQGHLKAEQRGWVKGRDECWKASDKHGCIKAAYQDRINELKDR